MPRSSAFLASLNDTELAFIATYKPRSYREGREAEIDTELRLRGLTPVSIPNLVAMSLFNPANTGCPCCDSHKRMENGACMICEWTDQDEDKLSKLVPATILDILPGSG